MKQWIEQFLLIDQISEISDLLTNFLYKNDHF